MGSIYAEVTKSKRWSLSGGGIFSAIGGADTRTIINFGVAIMIIFILGSMWFFLQHSFSTTFNNLHPVLNATNITNISGQTYYLNNIIK